MMAEASTLDLLRERFLREAARRRPPVTIESTPTPDDAERVETLIRERFPELRKKE